ncbi:nitronate monooxygenase [Actinomycetospora endophytica]|uniref:Propionate 3-nitronate monooxygenase n=1 Tax=Actinomycetospora endophytica TaxID=2291215 RepID=A0ABS8PCG1_9PSEU|nr:nitronate monooxygenase [Actinomycetospora endophytica]MCD2195592.1 nitronate monooxygenase [Actinomycetospora endophytica]
MRAEGPGSLPVVAAPMAGGPSSPALVAAVTEAGGYGYLAGGYLTAEKLDAQLAELRERTTGRFGVNLFLPPTRPRTDREEQRRDAAVDTYARRLTPEAAALGAELGNPRPAEDPDSGDALDEKIAVLAQDPPDAISVTFALPDPTRLAALRATGATLVATVTSVQEARSAAEAGFDGLCVQGAEAGGHRGTHDEAATPNETDTLDLLAAIRRATTLPMIAAGGIADTATARRALEAGAVAVQLGTALLRCPEAGTSTTHREALADPSFSGTLVTRAYTGRPARALTTRFAVEHGPAAPAAYPEVHHLTRPMRTAAAAAGDTDRLHLWAGIHFRKAAAIPVADVVRGLV